MSDLPPKIALKYHATRLRWTECDILNRAQDDGIISDNCVTMQDVCEVDAQELVEYCKRVPTPRPGVGESRTT
jgi:hypothetical protein